MLIMKNDVAFRMIAIKLILPGTKQKQVVGVAVKPERNVAVWRTV